MDFDLIALLVFLFPLAFSPGPGNMLFAANGARFGIRATFWASMGYHIATAATDGFLGRRDLASAESQGIRDHQPHVVVGVLLTVLAVVSSFTLWNMGETLIDEALKESLAPADRDALSEPFKTPSIELHIRFTSVTIVR